MKLCEEPTEQTEITDEEAINIVDDGELTFDHVTFKYDVKDILKDVSFRIPQGQVSACGVHQVLVKYDFNLIERMYDIDGEISSIITKVFMISHCLNGVIKWDM